MYSFLQMIPKAEVVQEKGVKRKDGFVSCVLDNFRRRIFNNEHPVALNV